MEPTGANLSGVWSIAEADYPKGRDLEALKGRLASLTAFPVAPAKAIGARLARLFLRFPIIANGSPEQVAAYTTDLQAYPLWAIEKGITDILSGFALRADVKAPTSMDVVRVVRKAMETAQDEAALISAVLNAKIVNPREERTEEERVSMREKLADLKADIRRNSGTWDERKRADDKRDLVAKAQARLEARDFPAGPITVSPSLQASLGKGRG